MTDIHDRLLHLEEEGYRAAAARDPSECERTAAAAADLDPDHWLILLMCGCADMMSGRTADAIAQWMAAADRMEDERDMHRMVSETSPLIAEASLGWPYPADIELAGLMALSSGLSELSGSGECDLMLSVLESMRGMVSETDQSRNSGLVQAASEVAYTAVMYGTDLEGGVACARVLIDISKEVLDRMEAHGVPDEMDRMPIEELREHVGVRMEAYRLMIGEWEANRPRLDDDALEAARAYWRERPQRSDALTTQYLDVGYRYSRTRSPEDLDVLRKAAKLYVLKWMRVRK